MSGNPYEPPTEPQSNSKDGSKSVRRIDYAGIWSFGATMLQPLLFWSFPFAETNMTLDGLLIFQYIFMVASGMVLGFNSTVRTLNGGRFAYFQLGFVGFLMSFVCVFGFPLFRWLV